ncbi:dihydrofolate reductase [Solemya velum gill symbiont]|uniref:dihydrofolate reductase n=1 Tax=Solemya velum gill symbiont TaxID=2340 RepID=UPI002DDC9ABE|nr:dihydrofolate reductase [Solemya velum gill symbiont]
MTRNRIIGRNNELPWHLPADLKHFKALTMGKPIIMGRKTWESLPGLLPGRQHIVVTRNPDYVAEDATIALSLDEAIAAAGDVPEVMIIGGANVYQQAIEIADTLYITKIDTEVDGETRLCGSRVSMNPILRMRRTRTITALSPIGESSQKVSNRGYTRSCCYQAIVSASRESIIPSAWPR